MANDKEFLIRVRADIQQAVRQMDQLNKELGQTAREGRSAARGIAPLGGAINGVVGALTAFVSLNTAVQILRTADAFNVLDQRVRTATQSTGDYLQVSARLNAISTANGVALQSSVALFQSLARTAPELRASNQEILTLVNSVQQLGRIGGSNNTQLSAGLLQFSQGLSAGVFRAEEFNSILENLPELANRIAGGMSLTVGELRNAVLEGRVLSRDVFEALIGQADQIQREFDQLPDALDQAATRLADAWGLTLSKIDQALGATQAIAGVINSLAEGVSFVGDELGGRSLDDARSRVSGLREELEDLENASAGARALRNLLGALNPVGVSEFGLTARLRLARQELAELERQAQRDQRSAEARFGSGEPRPDVADPADAKAQESAQKLVEALQLQAATLGQTSEQVALYRLQLAGASAEQIAAARAAADTIRAWNDAEAATRAKAEADAEAARAAERHQDAVDRVAQAAREALDPWERYRQELQLLEEALNQGLDPNAYRARIQAINDEINGLADTTGKTADRMTAFAEEAARGMQQAFSAHFFALLQGETDNLGARFKAMLDRMAADLLASQLLGFLLGDYGQNGSNQIGGLLGAALSGSGGGEGGSVQAASGGLITGPGTGTSDSIPARLSSGEYVVRAAAVQRYGTALMDSINRERYPALTAPRLAIPKHNFADGGLVTAGRGSGGVTLVQHISTPDANSFRRAEGQIGRDAAASLTRAQRRNG